MFARYHYLNHTHNNAASVYIALVNGQIAGFYSVLPFPHPIKKNTYRAHRFVILPDYQGAGIGMIFQNEIAKHYDETLNKTFILTTSHPAIVHALQTDPKWRMTRLGRAAKTGRTARIHKTSNNRITVAFQYVRNKQTS
jgi:GNAT superfamily N-acetyltransferase